jgi:hypothetical protein
MKKFFAWFAALAVMFSMVSFSVVNAAVHVNGYYRSNGTYVQPHYRSNPDGNPYNNWSYPGNTNPYTGKTATGNPDTYLQNYYSGSSSGASSRVISSNQVTGLQAISTPTPQTVIAEQPLLSTTERDNLIAQLKQQILALQIQLQIVLLQNQLSALTK